MSNVIVRVAPSPTGYLHVGNARAALLNYLFAHHVGGKFMLRIDDTDDTRSKPEFEEAIDQDLAWLGVSWEKPARRQSEHFAEYRAALEKLMALGLIYPAFESRAEIARVIKQNEAAAPWPRDPDGAPLYPGTARALGSGERERLLRSGSP